MNFFQADGICRDTTESLDDSANGNEKGMRRNLFFLFFYLPRHSASSSWRSWYHKAVKRAPWFMGSNLSWRGVQLVNEGTRTFERSISDAFGRFVAYQSIDTTRLDRNALVWDKQANSLEEFKHWKDFKTRFIILFR